MVKHIILSALGLAAAHTVSSLNEKNAKLENRIKSLEHHNVSISRFSYEATKRACTLKKRLDKIKAQYEKKCAKMERLRQHLCDPDVGRIVIVKWPKDVKNPQWSEKVFYGRVKKKMKNHYDVFFFTDNSMSLVPKNICYALTPFPVSKRKI